MESWLTFVVLNMISWEETDCTRGQDLSFPPGRIVFGQDFDDFVCLKAQLIVVLSFERIDRNHAL